MTIAEEAVNAGRTISEVALQKTQMSDAKLNNLRDSAKWSATIEAASTETKGRRHAGFVLLHRR